MGSLLSKDNEDNNEVLSSYDPKHIYYDNYGNLRYGIVVNDIIEEMRRMILNDSLSESNMTWYVIDSAWLSSWLHFAHYDKFVSPCPGPCRNDDLITFDHITEKWIPKKNLILATKDKPGHYCKVNSEVWKLFKECYENSGPEILIQNNHNKISNESTSTECWVIDQTNCPDKPEEDKSILSDDINDENIHNNFDGNDDEVIKTKSIKISELSAHSKNHSNKLTQSQQQNKHNHNNNNNNKSNNNNISNINIPSTEFTMEDETISKDTITDIQRFFGVNKSIQNKNKVNTKEFDNKYSNLTNIKKRNYSLTDEGSEILNEITPQPKDTKEMVAVWLFGENNLLP